MPKAMTGDEELRLLGYLAANVTEGCVVELGCYRGLAGVALARAARVPVYSIDRRREFDPGEGGKLGLGSRAAFYWAMLTSGCAQNVRLIDLPSAEVARGWSRPVGMLWIEGDRDYAALSADVDEWLAHLLPDATLVFSHVQSEGATRAVIGLDGWRVVRRVGKVAALRRARARA
jgi:hypothetical protein